MLNDGFMVMVLLMATVIGAVAVHDNLNQRSNRGLWGWQQVFAKASEVKMGVSQWFWCLLVGLALSILLLVILF